MARIYTGVHLQKLTSGNQNWAGVFRQGDILLLAGKLHTNLSLSRRRRSRSSIILIPIHIGSA